MPGSMQCTKERMWTWHILFFALMEIVILEYKTHPRVRDPPPDVLAVSNGYFHFQKIRIKIKRCFLTMIIGGATGSLS